MAKYLGVECAGGRGLFGFCKRSNKVLLESGSERPALAPRDFRKIANGALRQ